MKKLIARAGLILCISLLFTAYRWPVENGMITSTFCESRWDHFHDGIDMISPGDRVYPVAEGALLFYWDRAIFPLDNYPGGGNYKILEHSNGFCSVYMHLENGVSSKTRYAADVPVGIMDNTGHSNKKHIHFSLINIRSRTSVNPLTMLPPYSDSRLPEIKDIAFKIGEKYIIVRDKSNIRLTNHYPLLIKITDSAGGRESLGIYKLSVIFNEKEVLKYKCERLVLSNGRLTVENKGFDELYDKKGFYKVSGITYINGPNVLKIAASDYAGNLAEKEYTFNVKLDIAQ